MLRIFRELFGGVRQGTREDGIADEAAMIEFISTRAAHVAQSSLYGYLRTRMGTREREIFQDERFAEPLKTARDAMLAHCLSDLVVFAAATVEASDAGRETMALRWYRMAALAADADWAELHQDDALERFAARLARTDWQAAAEREGAFTESPNGLVAAAPVIDAFKELDGEIVRNSVRFRWTDVRRQLRERVDRTAFQQSDRQSS